MHALEEDLCPGRSDILNLEIHATSLGGPALVRDYLRGEPALAPFYAGFPFDPEAYRRKAEEVDRRFGRAERERMAATIRATSPGAAARLEEIVAGNGVFVTTGQQAGLFTGPLYTIYKILSAIQLARALEPVLERPVAPLFWVASDDHDWEEVNHVHVLNRKNTLHRLALSSPADAPPLSMRRRTLGPELESVLGDFIHHLPTTEFAADLLALLRDAYRPGRTVAGAFTDTLAHLLAPFDLLMVDGGQPGVKALASDVIERELLASAEHEALFAAQTARLEAAGYPAQVAVLEGATNVFYEDDGGRERIFREGSGFVLRHSGRRFGERELLALLRSAPERFSGNVALRPIVENAVFPTVAYVGGPGEVSYFGQYGELFRAQGIAMPVVFPRTSVLLVEPKVRRVLERFRLEVADFRRPIHELTARVVRQELPAEVQQAMAALRAEIEGGYGRLEAASLAAIDPMLARPLESARNATLFRLSEAEKRIMRHFKRRGDLELDQLEKGAANLFPLGQPQERVLNIFQYLVRYGQELLPALAGQMKVSLGDVRG